jgi:hypothetical protein
VYEFPPLRVPSLRFHRVFVWDKSVARYSVLSKAHKGYAERLPVALRSERGAPSGGLSSLFLCLSKTENDEEEVGGFLY